MKLAILAVAIAIILVAVFAISFSAGQYGVTTEIEIHNSDAVRGASEFFEIISGATETFAVKCEQRMRHAVAVADCFVKDRSGSVTVSFEAPLDQDVALLRLRELNGRSMLSMRNPNDILFYATDTFRDLESYLWGAYSDRADISGVRKIHTWEMVEPIE